MGGFKINALRLSDKLEKHGVHKACYRRVILLPPPPMQLSETQPHSFHLNQPENKDRFHWSHFAAWLGGILCALVPFVGAWEVGPMQVPVRFGSGNFGFNLLIATSLCFIGGIVGGYWWRLGKWWVGNRDRGLKVVSAVLFVLGILGNLTGALDVVFFYLVAAVLLAGLGITFAQRDRNARRVKMGGPSWFNFVNWLKKPTPWNVAFYLLLLLVLLINNLTLAWGLDVPLSGKIETLLGRFLTQIVVVGGCFLLIEMAMRATPRYFRWTPWMAFSLFPLLVVSDQLVGMMWSRPLINVVNVMTQSGDFKPEVELAASGLDVGPLGARLIVLGIWAGAGLIAWGCWVVSKRLKASISMRVAGSVILVAWLGVVALQGVGSIVQNVAARQLEHKAFDVNIGVFTPPKGVGSYKVTFFSGKSEFQGEIPKLEKKPDVFIFMLESTRADAIRPEVAPFLSRFRDEECQQLGETWSGANATHLSWFSFFHSRVAVFWRKALESIPDRKTFAGSVPLQQLKQAGYEIEVRAVCDLSYKDFGLSNFGAGTNLAKLVIQANDDSDFSHANIAERERLNFESLKKSVLARPQGGGLFYTALDSPHYNYYWHETFQPPFADYDEDTRFPLNPTKKEVERVKHRYWNAIAWADFQVHQFCEFLKKEGRYDESIIIVTGDHGEEFQEHGSWFHCSSLQPEQTHVPILIKWPKSMGRGPSHATANHLDVMPSLLSALGMPKGTIRGLAGKNLWEEDAGEGVNKAHTAISTTAYAGQSGETMVLRRGPYRAVFSWPKYWEAQVPDKVVLERITGPDGVILKDSPEDYAAELRRIFPDAFERFFKTFEVIR